ncbi:MAG: polysaccharide deacetylase family protein [Minisyncoccia bacterium]
MSSTTESLKVRTLRIFFVLALSLLPALFAHANSANLIANGNFETPDTVNPNIPQGWTTAGYGTNAAAFTYPASGVGNSKAAQITMSAYTSGDAKWLMSPVAVSAGHSYSYTDAYMSGVSTQLVVEYTDASSTITYGNFTTVPASASAWATSTVSFAVPANIVSVRVYHSILSVGTLTIDNASIVDSTPGPTISIAPTVLQNAAVNVPYSQTLTASTTASGPFSWSVSSGSLPSGFALSTSTGATAFITGTSTATSTGTFAVSVTNGAISATNLYSITVFPSVVSTATVKVITSVVNTHGGTNAPADFNVTVNGASSTPAFFVGAASGTNVAVAANTAYQITTEPGLYYDVSYSPDCTGQLPGGDSATCTITLSDLEPISLGQASPNLIQNPGLETPDPSIANQPLHWTPTSYGTNTPEFSYVAASTTNNEISPSGMVGTISMKAYADGDAKWVFDNVTVIPGHSYLYNDVYLSNVPTQLVVAYTNTDNSVTFADFTPVAASPATTTWEQSAVNFTVPAGVVSVTVYHTISSIGSLSIDNASLTEVPQPISFDRGFVTLSFDDGLLSQYQNAYPILSAAHMNGSFYIISHLSGMAVVNPNLETPNPASSTEPLGWLTSGSTNAKFTYPVAGQSGKAVEVSSTVAGSNAAWYFNPITVFSDENYSYADSYRSSAASDVIIQMTDASGTPEYINSAGTMVPSKVTALTLPSTNGAWSAIPSTFNFYVPPSIKTITVLHQLTGAGYLDVDNISFGAYLDYMTPAEILQMQAEGQEIGGHTQIHPDLTTLSDADQTTQIAGGRQDLLSYGVTPALTFVYPYGAYNSASEQIAQQAGYISSRTVLPGFNGRNTDIYALLSQSVDSDTTLAQIQSWIDQAKANKQWLILVFHPILTDLSNQPYGATPQTLQGIVNYLTANNVPVLTMAQGAALMGAPKLDVSVVVNNTHGATSTAADFTVNVTGASASPSSFQGTSSTTVVSIQPLQQYSVALQSVPSNYTYATSTNCAGSQLQGVTANCVITVNDLKVNYPPTASGSAATTTQNTAVQVMLSAADPNNDALTYSIVTPPSHGTLTGTSSVETYTPAAGFTGIDTFSFKANNGLFDSNVATDTVTVSSSVATSGPNLILNPTFAIASASNSSIPQNWSQGGWGTNTAVFSYPVAGHTDGTAAKVQITSYASGDAKWVFDKVAVTPGHTYTYSDSYESNIASQLAVEYLSTTGVYSYAGFTALPASASSWGTGTVTFTAPAGTASVRVFHLIAGIGTFTIDDASLTDSIGSSSPPPPSTTNLVANPTFAIANSTDPTLPQNWSQGGWGTNTAVFSYPVAGHTDGTAAKVQITSYTDGDSKWVMDQVPVSAGAAYTYSDSYVSDVSSHVEVEFLDASGNATFADDTIFPASTPAWGISSVTFTAPAGVVSAQVFHYITGIGSLTLDDVGIVAN